MTLLVLSNPQPARPSLPGNADPEHPGWEGALQSVCGRSRWMIIYPRVLRGVLCAQKVPRCPLSGRRGAPCAGLHLVMPGMDALSPGLSLVALEPRLRGHQAVPGCSSWHRVGTMGRTRGAPRMGPCAFGSPGE